MNLPLELLYPKGNKKSRKIGKKKGRFYSSSFFFLRIAIIAADNDDIVAIND